MKYFLVYCHYDYYCQGTDDTWGYFLVKARTFQEACRKVAAKVDNAREFVDRTIE